MNQERTTPIDLATLGDDKKEDSAYRNKVRNTLNELFETQLSREADEHNLKEQEIAGLIKRRIPVYLDAVKRGEVVFYNSLKEKPFVVLGQADIKTYSMVDGQLGWKITPKSNDQFEQIGFYKRYKSRNVPTEGVSDTLTDPILAEQSLNEGLRQQQRLYEIFDTAYQNAMRVKSLGSTTLQYTDAATPQSLPNALLNDLDQAYKRLQGVQRAEGLSTKDAFVSAFVVENDPIIDKCSTITKICSDILALHSIFRDGLNKPVESSRRQIYNNTLAVELVANPESFKQLSSLRQPITTVNRVFEVNRLIHSLQLNSQDRDFRVSVALLTQAVLAQSRNDLTKLFQEMHISEDVGIRFLSSMLYTTLRNFPGREIEGMNNATPSQLRGQSKLNTYYRLEDRIEPQNITESSEERESRVFIQGLISGKKSSFRELSEMSPERQKVLISALLSTMSKKEENEYKKTLIGFMRNINIAFMPSERQFGAVLPKRKSKDANLSTPEVRKSFLGACLDKVGQGDATLISGLDYSMDQSIINTYAQKLSPKVKHKDYLKDATFLFSAHGKTYQREDQGNIIDNLCIQALLDSHSTRADLSLEEIILDLKTSTLRLIDSYMTTAKIENRQDYLATLQGLLDTVRIYDFNTRAEELLSQYRNNCFGDDSQDSPTDLLTKTIENSLQTVS